MFGKKTKSNTKIPVSRRIEYHSPIAKPHIALMLRARIALSSM